MSKVQHRKGDKKTLTPKEDGEEEPSRGTQGETETREQKLLRVTAEAEAELQSGQLTEAAKRNRLVQTGATADELFNHDQKALTRVEKKVLAKIEGNKTMHTQDRKAISKEMKYRVAQMMAPP